jgi:hypothetical protein
MSKQLRFALLDLVWAHSLDAVCEAYRSLEKKDLTAHEREIAATLFNDLVHIWALSPLRSAARASNQHSPGHMADRYPRQI